MDTSETYMKWYEDPVYIKMCDCREIQQAAPPKMAWSYVGDFWSCEGDTTIGGSMGEEVIRRGSIWLPRQDELQGMLDDRFSNKYKCVLAGKFGRYCDGITKASGRFTLSMNQLWLAFVMKELWNKIREGENWITIKS